MPLFMQLKNIELVEGDIVIIVSTHVPHNGYDYEYLLKLTSALKQIKLYCETYKAKFYSLQWQGIFNKINLTEKEIMLLNYTNVIQKRAKIDRRFIQHVHSSASKLHEMVKSICLVNEINFIDLSSMFKDPEMDNKIFIDRSHYSPKANERMAKLIFVEIFIKDSVKLLCQNTKEWMQELINKRLEIMLTDEVYDKLDKYVMDLKQLSRPKEIINNLNSEGKEIGCIVVNCNPFTLGHRYLIEIAAKQVDLLYIFVVEENKSVYTFEERFKLVKENCKDLDNVVVVPSGNFIISQMTFSAYFNKENVKKGDVMSGPDVDLGIFCLKIAPELNITKRFVGEEPNCVVTNNYNIEMKKMLPKYGLEVIEIPRKIMGTDVISASKVRKCIIEETYDILEQLVPETTFEFLMAKHNR